MKLVRTSTVPGSLETFCKGLLKELQGEGYEVVAVSAPGDALSEIREREGVRTVEVPMERRISPLKDLRSLWRMIRVFRKEKPDMVHSITPKAGLLSMIAGKICRVPVRIHTFTGLRFPTEVGFKKRLLKFTDALTCIFATHIFAEGQGVKNDLIANHITKKNVQILGNGSINGVDTELFDPVIPELNERARGLVDDSVFSFIFVGRLVGDKGLNELVEAFALLNKENPKTRLLLLGEKEEELDQLKKETWAEIETNPAINYLGFNLDVRPYLCAADCLVLPSYREGFPNVVLEASSMELACIVTDINGSNEIVVNGETGLIVQPRSVDELRQAMISLAIDKQKTKKMGMEARRRIIDLYNTHILRTETRQFYGTVLS